MSWKERMQKNTNSSFNELEKINIKLDGLSSGFYNREILKLMRLIRIKVNSIESPYVKGIERSLENIAENLVILLVFTFMIFSLLFISIWHFW
jgi:hypothetical protein